MTGPIWAVLGALMLQQGGVGSQVDGRVERPAGKAMAPVANVTVTLHRVGPDTAAPMDSTRTDAAGRFHFTYHRFGSTEAIYFVSSSYDGIAYFSQPLHGNVVHGGDADVTVFDTTSKPVPMSIRGRHLIVSAPAADGMRDVVEVFEISNDSALTLVSPGAGERPTWSAALPIGAQRFAGGQGDVSPEAISQAGGRAQVVAPFAPGVKQLSYRYSVPASAFPLRVRLERPTSVLEVLLEEPMARLTGAGLKETNPVSADGRNFRRFLAQDLPATETIDVGVQGIAADKQSLFFAVLVLGVGGAMLVSLARAFSRGPTLGPPVVARPSDRLAQQIVDLDDTFAAREASLSADERAAYAATRSALKGELTTALKQP
ncbi:MAG TPA: carboxypeptidase-like regulatory domain-containing protein [Gemmatimonadaceae bacterium]|nr:carboxypeptidase-like regulatory domain-containing protein [Gemmatimonadaceae bacterium]